MTDLLIKSLIALPVFICFMYIAYQNSILYKQMRRTRFYQDAYLKYLLSKSKKAKSELLADLQNYK